MAIPNISGKDSNHRSFWWLFGELPDGTRIDRKLTPDLAPRNVVEIARQEVARLAAGDVDGLELRAELYIVHSDPTKPRVAMTIHDDDFVIMHIYTGAEGNHVSVRRLASGEIVASVDERTPEHLRISAGVDDAELIGCWESDENCEVHIFHVVDRLLGAA